MRTHAKYIIAHHLILTGYGFWLPNDPRGSGSTEIRNDAIQTLGPILPGRQRVQPDKAQLKQFHRSANPLLQFEPLWFDPAKRQVIAGAFARVVQDFKYTLYACAICSNHAHLLVRRHRDDAQTIWDVFADGAKESLLTLPDIPADHPVWSDRPYKVFLYTPDDIRTRIRYINHNATKEGLPPQNWDFVVPYNGWPHPKRI